VSVLAEDSSNVCGSYGQDQAQQGCVSYKHPITPHTLSVTATGNMRQGGLRGFRVLSNNFETQFDVQHQTACGVEALGKGGQKHQ
jgi:hypothetical protein